MGREHLVFYFMGTKTESKIIGFMDIISTKIINSQIDMGFMDAESKMFVLIVKSCQFDKK